MSSTNTQTFQERSKATAAAIASVQAEGLRPSASVKLRLKQYAEGDISASQLRRETLKEIRSRNN